MKPHAPIIFFYCDVQYDSDLSQLLSSFIRQLTEFIIKRAQPFSENGQKMLQRYFGSEREVPDIDDLEDIFAILSSDVPNATYVIDGLDALEQADARRLLTYFRSLCRTGGDKAIGPRLLIFSREYFVGGTSVATYLPKVPQISTTYNVLQDIQVYIRESIADRMVLQPLTEDNQLIRDMENILLQESSGM